MPDIKETLIDLLTGYSLDTYEDVQYVADELIAMGVLPVVRCKDCKFYDIAEDGWFFCNCFGGLHQPDANDFCSCGERKDGDKE